MKINSFSLFVICLFVLFSERSSFATIEHYLSVAKSFKTPLANETVKARIWNLTEAKIQLLLAKEDSNYSRDPNQYEIEKLLGEIHDEVTKLKALSNAEPPTSNSSALEENRIRLKRKIVDSYDIREIWVCYLALWVSSENTSGISFFSDARKIAESIKIAKSQLNKNSEYEVVAVEDKYLLYQTIVSEYEALQKNEGSSAGSLARVKKELSKLERSEPKIVDCPFELKQYFDLLKKEKEYALSLREALQVQRKKDLRRTDPNLGLNRESGILKSKLFQSFDAPKKTVYPPLKFN